MNRGKHTPVAGPRLPSMLTFNPPPSYFRPPWWLRQERVCLQCGWPGFDPWVGKISWRRKWQPTPVFLSGEFPWTEEPGELQFMGSQRVGRDSGANFHFSLSLSSYFELSNYSFSRNWFTLAKKKSQSANQSFQRKSGISRCLSCSTGIPVRRYKLHLTSGDQPAPILQSASRQGSSRGATNCWPVSATTRRKASDAGIEGHTCTHLGHTSREVLQFTFLCWATATEDKRLSVNPRQTTANLTLLYHSQSRSTFQRRNSSDMWKRDGMSLTLSLNGL